MTSEEHKQIHKDLHENLDKLIACYIQTTERGLRETNLMELIEWSHKMTTEAKGD